MPSTQTGEPRVLHVLTDPSRPSRDLLFSLLAATPEAGYSAVASPDLSLASHANDLGAPFHRLQSGTGKRVAARNSSALRKALHRVRPDVVHVHDLGAALALRMGTVGRSGPATVASVYEEQVSYTQIARLLNLSDWTAIASGPTVGRQLRDAGYQGRLRTILTGGSWRPPRPEEITATQAKWGIATPYLVGLASDEATPAWQSIVDAIVGLEGMELVVVDDQIGDYEVLVAGSVAVVTTTANQPTRQVLGPLSLGVPVVVPTGVPRQGWIPADAAVAIDFSVEDLVGAVTSLVDPATRRNRSALGQDAAGAWATPVSAAAFYELYRAKMATGSRAISE